jgi:hypothetical protein
MTTIAPPNPSGSGRNTRLTASSPPDEQARTTIGNPSSMTAPFPTGMKNRRYDDTPWASQVRHIRTVGLPDARTGT